MLNRLDEAAQACADGLNLQPDNTELLRRRGYVHLRQNDLDGALTDFEAALSQDPDNSFTLYGRGVVRIRKGDRAAGEADIAQAQRIDQRVDRQAPWLWLDYDPDSGDPPPRRATPSR
jgi:Flp pilus assembly protein TadD